MIAGIHVTLCSGSRYGSATGAEDTRNRGQSRGKQGQLHPLPLAPCPYNSQDAVFMRLGRPLEHAPNTLRTREDSDDRITAPASGLRRSDCRCRGALRQWRRCGSGPRCALQFGRTSRVHRNRIRLSGTGFFGFHAVECNPRVVCPGNPEPPWRLPRRSDGDLRLERACAAGGRRGPNQRAQ